MSRPTALYGLDFSCAPSKRKPLTLARGVRQGQVVKLDRVDLLTTLDDWSAWLQSEDSTGLMGCDFPFGLPRPFVGALASCGPGDLMAALQGVVENQPLPDMAPSSPASPAERLIQALHAHCKDRAGFQKLVDDWGSQWDITRPTGSKLLHRVTDQAMPGISSTSPLQTRYVPVGKMYFEGLIRLIEANFSLPGLRPGRENAVALEAYPGLLAGEILGRRSYKSETDATSDRLIARMDLVDALEQGRTRLGLRLKLTPAQRDHLVSDPKGDRLDAVLCLVQAAWADLQRENGHPCWGLPTPVDPVEGWILTA